MSGQCGQRRSRYRKARQEAPPGHLPRRGYADQPRNALEDALVLPAQGILKG
jgi:hypothetical protein